jgi:DNA-binding Lrp family transcriptional regulator
MATPAGDIGARLSCSEEALANEIRKLDDEELTASFSS